MEACFLNSGRPALTNGNDSNDVDDVATKYDNDVM